MGNNQSNKSEATDGNNNVEFRLRIADGRFRQVFQGIFLGDLRRGRRCVVKLFKEPWFVWSETHGVSPCRAVIRAPERAQEMAKQFHKKYPAQESIEFILPEISKIKSSAGVRLLGFIPIRNIFRKRTTPRRGDNISIERHIEGSFITFVSNIGCTNEDEAPGDTVPAAFCHFTYHQSSGAILVCDLKGVHNRNRYVFTNPIIHSQIGDTLGYFGPTDQGLPGMLEFFRNHECNDICTDLKKPTQ